MTHAAHHAGLTDLQAAPILARLVLGAEDAAKLIAVTPTQGAAQALAKNLAFFLNPSEWKIVCLADEDPPFLKTYARSREAEAVRLAALDALAGGGRAVVVCPVSAALHPVGSKETFRSQEIVPGGAGPGELKAQLAGAGYRRTPFTESPGEFSVRGDIIDVFPVNTDEPIRIDFFGDEIESIRTFDPLSQLATGILPEAPRIAPAEWTDGQEGKLTVVDWLTDGDVFACMDPARIYGALELQEKEALDDFTALLESGEAAADDWSSFRGRGDWDALLMRRPFHFFTPYANAPDAPAFADAEMAGYQAKSTAAFFGQLDLVTAELKRYLRAGFAVNIVSPDQERIARLRELAEGEGIAGQIAFLEGELTGGIELTGEKRVWLWDGDIFKSAKRSRKRSIRGGEKIAAFSDIEKGDYIVHERHGIGVYRGIRTIEVNGSEKDYLCLAYAGKDVLYIPVEQMDLVQKYIGGGERRPKISKLGTADWSRTKESVRTEIEEYAGELLRMAAERKLSPGYAFSPDTVWQKDFEDRFPYEPTPDQVRCFEAVRRDMENPWPMDRLICGDVGYGKTEVALRAVFKCAADSKQAAILVPTTILASQHFRTFSERFADFPVRVEMLSRFQTPAQQKKIIAGLRDGSVDVVIGTHSLLSQKVAFKDLGLLVIDEEQRFGVRHKERIRSIRAGVDVLTLTATPIPRTLNMSLLGIKDMELIEDPPEDRFPVRTYVTEESTDVIRESIMREIDRGGQVYVVFNRVSGIERVSETIRGLIPDVRIGVCHAKMDERTIEENMLAFYEGDFDVLVSTTIIESGLDIPNVNTIIILDADRLGLTQIYQLRGRVGRTNRIAFAYLMVSPDKALTETAEKRLRTIREFTEFGSGFKIAMKDLEIRGAGNLLGTSQHGHMAAIGYELYVRLMDEAVARLAGRAPETLSTGEECRVEADVPAVIPVGYIEDEVVKLQAYKRISFVADEGQAEAVLTELEDRFGPVPAAVRNLVYVSLAKHLAEHAGLFEVNLSGDKAVLVYLEAPADFLKRVFSASEAVAGRLTVDGKGTPKLLLEVEGRSGEERLKDVCGLLKAIAL
ncbi:MAG: transcription-repair coupling factor [Clostridiales Family XIII bacterium]|jgi:transcription-repair coupling factor (superfamily II helicase)|nr:transcription-repair coupling factor [Clostridiales Family XIII bacterium]